MRLLYMCVCVCVCVHNYKYYSQYILAEIPGLDIMQSETIYTRQRLICNRICLASILDNLERPDIRIVLIPFLIAWTG